MKTYQIIIVIVLGLMVGYLLAKLKDKKKQDIIKLLFRQDMLPAAAPGTNWLEGGSCAMQDGSYGKVKGIYCQQIKPL